jgi:hypothetical protein
LLDQTAIDELSASLHVSQALAPRNNTRTRISGIGGCRRQLAYRRLWYKEGKVEPPIWSHGLFTFDIGHAVHLKLQHRLSNAGPLKWVDADPIVDEHGNFGWAGNCEINLRNDELEFEGHLDDLTRPLKRVTRDGVEFIVPTAEDDPKGRRYIIDIKTITARERTVLDEDPHSGQILGAKTYPSAFEKLKAPKDEHIQQVSMYCYLTTQPGFKTDRIPGPLKELPGIMMIYVAKDLDPKYYGKKTDEFSEARGLLNSPYKIFTLDADPRLIQALLTKNRLISQALKEGKLPPRDFQHKPDRPAWACVDCPFRHTCYGQEGYFVDDLPTVPPRLAYHLSEVDYERRVLG